MHVSSPPPILEGIRPSLLRMYCRVIRYPLEASSSIFSVASQILCQAQHSLPSTAAIPVRYRALCCHLRNWGTTLFCDPLTCDRTSASPFGFRIASLHHNDTAEITIIVHIVWFLLIYSTFTRCSIIGYIVWFLLIFTISPRCSITVFSGHVVVIVLFFFVVFHHNPYFSVPRPNIIVWHETLKKQVGVKDFPVRVRLHTHLLYKGFMPHYNVWHETLVKQVG